MSLELHHALTSTCSQKVRLVLAEKHLDWTSKVVNLSKGEHLAETYLQINPNGLVPTLVHDGAPIIDSSVINEYLEDVFPERPVRPREARAVAHMRAWRQYIDEVPTPAIRVPSFNAYFVPAWSKMTEQQFFEYTEQLPLRKHFYRKMGRKGFSESDVSEALDKLRQTLDRMEQTLGDGPWLVGSQYTIADASITPTILRMDDCGLSHMWRELPRVSDWYDRIRNRPSFIAAYLPGSRDLGPGGELSRD
ncbi:glutathione S-transferase [Bradyrhizobium sp. S3.3.6]|uniref:glutathione S-transferase family protein n=1 Tax=Bradyrhizobium sp. S3.3.6 TaxID=3156429 RepID=UPI00339A0FAD